MPDKTCQFCSMVGPAFTFINGVTICQPCFKTVPADIHEAWKTIFSLRTRAEAAERERDEYKECYRLAMTSVNDAYDKGYAKGQRNMQERVVQLTRGLTNEVAALAVRVAVRGLPIEERPQ